MISSTFHHELRHAINQNQTAGAAPLSAVFRSVVNEIYRFCFILAKLSKDSLRFHQIGQNYVTSLWSIWNQRRAGLYWVFPEFKHSGVHVRKPSIASVSDPTSAISYETRFACPYRVISIASSTMTWPWVLIGRSVVSVSFLTDSTSA